MRILHARPPSKKSNTRKKKRFVKWTDLNAIESLIDEAASYFLRTNYNLSKQELKHKFHVPENMCEELIPRISEKMKHVLHASFSSEPRVVNSRIFLSSNMTITETIEDTETTQLSVTENSLEDRLRDIRKRKEAQQTDRKNSVIEDGFLYLVTSPAYPGWTKVGQTSDYEARLQTYQTASPFADFQMIAKKYVSNRINEERKFLQLASSVFSVRGEWINAVVDDLKLNF